VLGQQARDCQYPNVQARRRTFTSLVPPMLCRVEDVLRSSLCRFISASFAFFAKISSLRDCIVPATHAHIGREGTVGFWSVSPNDFGGDLLSMGKTWWSCNLKIACLNVQYGIQGCCLTTLLSGIVASLEEPRISDHVQRGRMSQNPGQLENFSDHLKRKASHCPQQRPATPTLAITCQLTRLNKLRLIRLLCPNPHVR
jgi:hypothetical protein